MGNLPGLRERSSQRLFARTTCSSLVTLTVTLARSRARDPCPPVASQGKQDGLSSRRLPSPPSLQEGPLLGTAPGRDGGSAAPPAPPAQTPEGLQLPPKAPKVGALLGLPAGQEKERGRGWSWRFIGEGEAAAWPGSGAGDQRGGSRTGRTRQSELVPPQAKPSLSLSIPHALSLPPPLPKLGTGGAAPHPWGHRPPERAISSLDPPGCQPPSQALGKAAELPAHPWLLVSFFCPCRTAIVTTGGWFSFRMVSASLQCTAET